MYYKNYTNSELPEKNRHNVRFGVLLLVIAILFWFLLVVIAEGATTGDNLTNLTPISTVSPAAPFITIDPIGNHTVTEVFFINGTTNLPAFENLNIYVGEDRFNPSGEGSSFSSTVPIQAGESGLNFWSCNITPTLWTTIFVGAHSSTSDIKYFNLGEYGATVSSVKFNVTSYFGAFAISSTGISNSTNASGIAPIPTEAPFIAIDPVGNHTIGEVLFINGTTNLPWQKI